MLRRENKAKLVEELKTLIASHKTVAVLDMTKMPARQFLKIKSAVTANGGIKIKMARKGLIARALKESGKAGIENLLDDTAGTPALIFSNIDAFKLFSLLKKNRATSAAKVGQTVSKDVIIHKGPTQISPGPAISTLSKVGLKTRVEGGKIAIADDKVLLKSGQAVTDDTAAVLSLLKIEPVEIGLNLVKAYEVETGAIYGSDVLDVNIDQYLRDIERAIQAGINLSLNAGYVTRLTAPLAIQLAFWRAKSLCLAANVFEKDVIGEILAKAVSEAQALEAKVPAEQPAQSQS